MLVKGDKRYYGEVLGIARFDRHYCHPNIPGDVENASTYPFPVRMKIIEGLYDNPFPPVRDEKGNYTPEVQKTVNAVKELEADGVRAIVMACGYFSLIQDILTDEVEIPVFSSPLQLLPLIAGMIGKKKKTGILVAAKDSFSRDFLEPVGVDDSIPYVIAGLERSEEFNSCFMGGTRTEMDVRQVREDVVGIAAELVEQNPDMGAILLECSALPPYSASIQQTTGLPVFDYITFIHCIYRSVVQTEYSGIM